MQISYKVQLKSKWSSLRMLITYMAKLDLKSAYRSVNISQHSQKVTGLQ